MRVWHMTITRWKKKGFENRLFEIRKHGYTRRSVLLLLYNIYIYILVIVVIPENTQGDNYTHPNRIKVRIERFSGSLHLPTNVVCVSLFYAIDTGSTRPRARIPSMFTGFEWWWITHITLDFGTVVQDCFWWSPGNSLRVLLRNWISKASKLAEGRGK